MEPFCRGILHRTVRQRSLYCDVQRAGVSPFLHEWRHAGYSNSSAGLCARSRRGASRCRESRAHFSIRHFGARGRVTRITDHKSRCGPRPSSHTRKARTTGDLVSGLLWGAMPCSLVYSTMIWAATLGHPVQSAAVMFAFGCGTLPSMILTGVAGRKLHGLMRQVRPLAGAALVLYGVVTFPAVQNLWMSHDEGHSHVQHGTQ